MASSTGSVALILLLTHRIAVLDSERHAARALSMLDSLTGLANRRAFDSFLQDAFALARLRAQPLSLLMVDVDNFKSYNDRYGHPAGDELLVVLSTHLRSVVRRTDLVARIGGEEFALILPGTDLAGACLLAERARSTIEGSMAFRCPVTISVGVVSLDETTDTTGALIRKCDAELYRAKRSGRNRVASSGEAAASAVRAGGASSMGRDTAA
jgi:diguanylate cyclase (GGDEF)-like protein